MYLTRYTCIYICTIPSQGWWWCLHLNLNSNCTEHHGHPGLLAKHSGHIELSKACAQSLFQWISYAKKGKVFNAGMAHSEEVKEVFSASTTCIIHSSIHPFAIPDNMVTGHEVIMHNVSHFYYDQARQWMMNHSGGRIVALDQGMTQWGGWKVNQMPMKVKRTSSTTGLLQFVWEFHGIVMTCLLLFEVCSLMRLDNN